MGIRIHPFGNKLYFRRMFTPDPDWIVLSDNAREDCQWNELIGYGPDCKHMKPEYVGMIVQLPVIHNNLHRLGYIYEDVNGVLVEPEEWCFPEPDLIATAGYLVLHDK